MIKRIEFCTSCGEEVNPDIRIEFEPGKRHTDRYSGTLSKIKPILILSCNCTEIEVTNLEEAAQHGLDVPDEWNPEITKNIKGK